MGLVKRIICKVAYFVKNRYCRLLVNTARNASVYNHITIVVFKTVYEILSFHLHLVNFFLGNHSPHGIRSAKRISRKHAHNLQYLLLINHAAVGYV